MLCDWKGMHAEFEMTASTSEGIHEATFPLQAMNDTYTVTTHF
jgi:hypothetical protein